MLTKKVIIGVVTIMEDKRLQVREDTVVYEDDVELSRTYSRYITSPGDDVSGKPQFIQDLSKFLWTPEIVAAWKEKASKFPLGNK